MSDNKDWNLYNSLVRQKEKAKQKYDNYIDDVEECRYLLKRLRAARDIVAEQKDVFLTVVNSDKTHSDKSYGLKGNNYKKINKKYDEVLRANDTYYKSIDFTLDALNDEITRVKNKRDEALGVIGDLTAVIRNLGNEIRNFFN